MRLSAFARVFLRPLAFVNTHFYYTPFLVTRLKIPPHRETGVAIPLSHCVSCGIADYRCYTSFPTIAYRNPKIGLTRGYRRKSLALKPIALQAK